MDEKKNKIVAGILGILLGGLGIHWFYLGNSKRGVLYLLITILLCWTVVAPLIMEIIGFVEGLIMLMKTDSEFDALYNKQPTQPQV